MSATSARRAQSQAARSARPDARPDVRWHRDVPSEIRALDTLATPDYTDVVTATIRPRSDRSPEEWIRAMVAGTPRALLVGVPVVQVGVLGLRLNPRPSPDRLLGWKVAERGQNWVRLEAASWLLTGHIIVHVDGARLSFATFVRYHRSVAALVWPPVSLIHRQVALAMMRGGLRA